jgi:hypothetical protein
MKQRQSLEEKMMKVEGIREKIEEAADRYRGRGPQLSTIAQCINESGTDYTAEVESYDASFTNFDRSGRVSRQYSGKERLVSRLKVYRDGREVYRHDSGDGLYTNLDVCRWVAANVLISEEERQERDLKEQRQSLENSVAVRERWLNLIKERGEEEQRIISAEESLRESREALEAWMKEHDQQEEAKMQHQIDQKIDRKEHVKKILRQEISELKKQRLQEFGTYSEPEYVDPENFTGADPKEVRLSGQIEILRLMIRRISGEVE